jgi:hypothetical protein
LSIYANVRLVDALRFSKSARSHRGLHEIDVPGLVAREGMAEIVGQYPSKGQGERAAWFRDSEGKVIAISELVP